ncbi:MAG TPA: ABC transporter substrate-binding protein [Gemmatimonadaceae bacterium]|nr:ABC transporter substrate-binding protein [Gemmatimonadaceae bacterium]
MRVLSLLPAATDIVAALGRGAWLVGVTHECDAPEAAGAARVTRSAVDAAQPAGAVDGAVRALAATGAPIFTLDEARIAALAPDVVLTQRLCDVCAVSETDVRALAARLVPAPRVVTLGGTTLDGIWADVRAVAGALGEPARGAALLAAAEARLRRVHETLKAARAPRPRVAVIEWTDPPYAAGHWVPELVRRAGGVDVLATPGEHSRPRAPAEIAAADPEVLLIAPCGYDVARAEAEARALLARDEWAWARGRRVWALDANALTSRPGPGVVRAVEVLAAIVAPGLFGVPAPDGARRVAPT